MSPTNWPDGLPNLYTSLLTKLIRAQGHFLSLYSLGLFLPFYSPCLLCFIFLSSFYSHPLFCLIISAFPFFLPYLVSFFRLSLLFFCSLPSVIPLPLFFRFHYIFRPIFTSPLFLCRILASLKICVCPVKVIPIIIGVTDSQFSNIPDTEALPNAVPYVCMI